MHVLTGHRRARALATVALAVTALAASGVVTAAATTPVTTPLATARATYASAYRSPSPMAGSVAYDPSNSTASGYARTSEVAVTLSRGSHGPSLSVDMQAPSGQALQLGRTYAGDDVYGVRGLGEISSGESCEGVEFTVVDIAATGTTVTRLDLTFRTACPANDDGYAFGELEFGEPSAATGVSVSAAHLTWPVDPIGLISPAVAPVRVVNTGTTVASVTKPALSGSTGEFRVAASTCGATLAAHAACQLTFSFDPQGAGARTGGATLAVGGHPVAVALSGKAPPGRTVLTMTSQSGDPVGLGRTYLITDAQYPFRLNSLDGGDVDVTTDDGLDQWTVRIVAPHGLPITTGTHVAGTSADDYALSVNGNGSGCGAPGGTVTVNQVGFAANGDVDVLDARFVQRCESTTAALTGEIAYRATTAVPAPPAAPFVMRSGATVLSGATLTATWGEVTAYTLTVGTDGNLVERDGTGTAVWSSRTHSPGARLTMATTGRLTLVATGGSTVWTLGTSGSGHFAVLQSNGDLVVDNAADQPVADTGSGVRPA